MTISKGSVWGQPGALPDGAPVVGSDAELAAVAVAATAGRPVVGLAGGSLWRTMGGPAVPGRVATADAWRYPVDLVRVELDGRPQTAVAWVLARRACWRHSFVVMNSQWMADYQLGHRAHPGDALLDVYEAHLACADVWKVAARARNGAHLPHPGIRERRVGAAEFSTPDGRPWRVWIDGHRAGRARHIAVRVDPDALDVVL